MATRLSDIVAPHFARLHRDIMEHGHTFYWLEGGRGSTKSSYISLVLPLLMIKNPNCHAVVLRKVGNTIAKSVYTQIEWGINTLGLSAKFRFRSSPPVITYKSTGQQIVFLGVDDPKKIKSLKLPFGYVGVVWFEELDQYAGMEEIRNVNQSLLRGGSVFWEFCSFNPPKSQNNWVNEEKLFDDPERLVHHSTYLGVPRAWLGEQFFSDADKLKAKSELLYAHEYLGEVTGTGGTVFDNVQDIKLTDYQVRDFDRLFYGMDFGFATDPLAFVAMHYDAKREDLYIFREIYGQRIKNKPAVDMISKIAGRRQVQADSAEPRTISEFRDLGLNIYGAKKGPDSVEHGMKWLQERAHIYIDKRRAPNTYREFVNYEYERNRDGQFISAYPDRNNHCLTGDTLIACSDGEKPIKDVRAGDYVHTREGLKKIIWSGETRRNACVFSICADGYKVTGTADHKIFTVNRGWLPIGHIQEGDLLLCTGNKKIPVQCVMAGGIEKAVYDLTVEDAHEFFANGVLVHNCIDATRYAMEPIMRHQFDLARAGMRTDMV